MPLGKIIDDLAKEGGWFKPYEDMVDAEFITHLITGIPTNKGLFESAHIITCDPVVSIQERIKVAKKIFDTYKNNEVYKLGPISTNIYRYDFDHQNNSLKYDQCFTVTML